MRQRGRLQAYTAPADPYLEIAGIMKRLDGGPALLFTDVRGHNVPGAGQFSRRAGELRSGLRRRFRDHPHVRRTRVGGPDRAGNRHRRPVHERIVTRDIDLGRMFPVLHHTAADSGRFITAGVVVTRDLETGVYNASYHRLQLGDRKPHRDPARFRPSPARRVGAREGARRGAADRGLHRHRHRAAVRGSDDGFAAARTARRTRGRRRPLGPRRSPSSKR